MIYGSQYLVFVTANNLVGAGPQENLAVTVGYFPEEESSSTVAIVAAAGGTAAVLGGIAYLVAAKGGAAAATGAASTGAGGASSAAAAGPKSAWSKPGDPSWGNRARVNTI